MSDTEETPTDPETPKQFRGGGWVFERIGNDWAVHREGVSPSSADAGEVLYVREEELFQFVTAADFAGAVLLPLAAAEVMFGNCPLTFIDSVNEAVMFSTFGIPPGKGTRVNVPGCLESGWVADVTWTYGKSGARSAKVYLDLTPRS